MDKVYLVISPNLITGEEVEHAIIDHGNGYFSSMTKETYDELSAIEAQVK